MEKKNMACLYNKVILTQNLVVRKTLQASYLYWLKYYSMHKLLEVILEIQLNNFFFSNYTQLVD